MNNLYGHAMSQYLPNANLDGLKILIESNKN